MEAERINENFNLIDIVFNNDKNIKIERKFRII